MTLWTLRHPPVDRQGRCVGQTVLKTTISLDEAVRRATETAPFRPARLFSSDLPRCAMLARGLAEAWSIPLQLDPSLREMDFGEWEGRTYDALDTQDGTRWRAWCENWRTLAPTITGQVIPRVQEFNADPENKALGLSASLSFFTEHGLHT